MKRTLICGKDKRELTEEEYRILKQFYSRRTYFKKWLKTYRLGCHYCESCAFPTFTSFNSFEICHVCGWENNDYGDDELLWPNHDANAPLTLLDYRLDIGRKLKITQKKFNDQQYFKYAVRVIKAHDNDFEKLCESELTYEEFQKPADELFASLLKQLNV